MLLGLDLGSRSTGWCCGDGRSTPRCGAWSLGAERKADGSHDYGALLAGLGDYLDVGHRRFGFTALAYEAPLLITRRPLEDGYGDTLAKLRLLYPLGAFVELWARRHAVSYREKTVQSIKSTLAGDRFAGKPAMVAAAEACGLKLPADGADDAADSFGVWLLLLQDLDRATFAHWDQRLSTSRGGLI